MQLISAEDIAVPEKFRLAVELHLLRQTLDLPGVPLILGIHGPPGSGKTFQCEFVLRHLSIRIFALSGGELENKQAGQPAAVIRERYLLASESVSSGVQAVLMINDFDTGGGDWGPLNQTTVNLQTVYGQLMHLCDFPHLVENDRTNRIPIIITGNDFTKIYEPLRRPGRMVIYEWSPDSHDKVEVLAPMFSSLNRSECSALVSEFPEFQVSAFSQIKARLYDAWLTAILRSKGFEMTYRNLLDGVYGTSPDYELRDIRAIAADLRDELKLSSHLGGGR